MIEGERKLASVRRVANIEPIEGADRIVKATIDGWELVTQKDNGFKPGDLVCYFEIDSFLPVRPEFEFLRKGCFKSTTNLGEGFRIKTIKLRGQLSQGLILPLKDFFKRNEAGQYVYEMLDTVADPVADHLKEGDDLTEFLGVKKYEKPESGPGGNRFGPSHSRGSFPSFIPKTDQERVQNCWGGVKNWIYYGKPEVTEITDPKTIESLEDAIVVHDLSHSGISFFKSGDQWFRKAAVLNDPATIEKRSKFEVSVKLDGSSMTVYYNDGHIGVCSRNLDLKRDEANVFWRVALEGDLLQSLVTIGKNVAVQGELMGPGVQGNREGLEFNKMFIFDIYDIDDKRYMTPSERYAFLWKIFEVIDPNQETIEEVPIIEQYAGVDENLDVKWFLGIADSTHSLIHEVAEGVVYKSLEPGGPSFKVISNKYLLAEKD